MTLQKKMILTTAISVPAIVFLILCIFISWSVALQALAVALFAALVITMIAGISWLLRRDRDHFVD